MATSYVSTPEALEKIHRMCRRVLTLNGVRPDAMRIPRTLSLGIGGVAVDVEVFADSDVTFTFVYSIFDSDSDLAVRIARALEPQLPMEHVMGHEMVYCWCGHSGDSWLEEKGDHFSSIEGALVCCSCHDNAGSRRRRLLCPCCVSGMLPFDTARGRIQRCRFCRGIGVLKPDHYGQPVPAVSPAAAALRII